MWSLPHLFFLFFHYYVFFYERFHTQLVWVFFLQRLICYIFFTHQSSTFPIFFQAMKILSKKKLKRKGGIFGKLFTKQNQELFSRKYDESLYLLWHLRYELSYYNIGWKSQMIIFRNEINQYSKCHSLKRDFFSRNVYSIDVTYLTFRCISHRWIFDDPAGLN